MKATTLGQLLLNDALPEDMRDYDRVLDGKAQKQLLQQVAETRPHEYREIVQRLNNVGRDAAYTTGGYSFGLRHLRTTLAAQRMRLELGAELRNLQNDPALDDKTRDEKIIIAAGKAKKKMLPLMMKELAEVDNPLLRQVTSGARAKQGEQFLSSLLGADLLYSDHTGEPLPIPVTRNYSQGLTPVEYFAGAFGTRKGVIDLKAATQDAGYFGKQLVSGSHRLLVSGHDDDLPYDELTPRGLPVDTDDVDNEGALLAHPMKGYPRNTELTPKILKDLKNRGVDQILVRSPTVGGPNDGGVYARDVGRRERGSLPPVGDFVGIAAAQALAEPVTQAQISSKHTGGVAGAAEAGAISGFKYLNQLVQVPKTFKGGAGHAQRDGRVEAVREAPAGGHFVTIGGEEHYVGTKQALKVKVGDTVEAGDVISDGTPNPAEIVKHKGIGEGRRYFMEAFRNALNDSSVSNHRRNVELLARGLVNHVRMTDEHGAWSPDDVVPYQSLERDWEPRPGHVVAAPKTIVGHYLERPVLHYTIGTQIKPSMVQQMQRWGVKKVFAHPEPPPFQPEMIRGAANAAQDTDWMSRFLGGDQKKTLLKGVARGDTADEMGTSYVPALATGTDFGRMGATQGWKP